MSPTPDARRSVLTARLCPPVVGYSRGFLARAAGELDMLPPGSAIEQMLADYQVARDQARVCGRQVSSTHSEASASWDGA